MSAQFATKSTDSPPSILTPLQNQAIKWIAGMRFAMARHEKARLSTHKRKTWEIPAHQLQVGMTIITRNGKLYSVTEISPYKGGKLMVKGRNQTRCVNFFYPKKNLVTVEGL